MKSINKLRAAYAALAVKDAAEAAGPLLTRAMWALCFITIAAAAMGFAWADACLAATLEGACLAIGFLAVRVLARMAIRLLGTSEVELERQALL